jgi:hypothetical protein
MSNFRKRTQSEIAVPIWITQIPGIPDVILNWNYWGTDPQPVFCVFINGIPYAETTATSIEIGGAGQTLSQNLLISKLQVGVSYRFDVIVLSSVEAQTQNLGTYIYVPARGSRLVINIPKINIGKTPATNSTFYSYLLYWSTDGSNPTVLLAELKGANNTRFVTESLQNGTTYKFRIKLKSITGNESDYGPIASGTVNIPPLPVLTPAISYNSSTRHAIITATLPTENSSFASFKIFSNYYCGINLLSQIQFDNPIADNLISGSWTSQELFAGYWQFCMVAVDQDGLTSSYTILQLNLGMSGSNLIQIVNPPIAPQSVSAVPVSGGNIDITVNELSSSGIDHINIYINGIVITTLPIVSGQTVYNYTATGLTNNATYNIQTSNIYETIESTLTSIVACISDDNIPSGNMILTIGLTN